MRENERMRVMREIPYLIHFFVCFQFLIRVWVYCLTVCLLVCLLVCILNLFMKDYVSSFLFLFLFANPLLAILGYLIKEKSN